VFVPLTILSVADITEKYIIRSSPGGNLMERSKRRWAALFVVVALVAAGCGSDDDDVSSGGGGGGGEGDTIVIGAAVSLSGQLSREGTDTRRGYEMWQDWVNEQGGIDVDGTKHPVEIKFYDDESDTEQVTLLTDKLITEDGAIAVLGPYSSGLTQAASAITERRQVPMVEANGASEAIFERDFQYVFGVLTPGQNYTRAAIETAAGLGAETAVVAYEDESFAIEVADGAKKWLEENDIELLGEESYPLDVSDVSSIVTQFSALEPDLFIGAGHFNDAVLFVRQSKDLGFNPKAMILTVGPSTPTFVEEIGADAEHVWGATQWEPSFAYEDDAFGTAADYAEAYEAEHGTRPSYQAAESTAAGLVLQDAIERAGSLDPKDIRDALAETDLETFYGPIHFDESGMNDVKPMGAIQIQGGEIVPIAPDDVATAEPVYPAPPWDQR
jgi:branched-chain amino acid transport system substrate-binding protein